MTDSSDRPARLVRWLIRHRAAVMGVAVALAIVAGWRTVATYANLRSDLEELLPETAPSVRALDQVRARLPGLRHLGIVVDTGGPENTDQATRFLDDLSERVREYPPELVMAVRSDVKLERRFAETYVLQLMEPADVIKLREAVEDRRDWKVTRAMDMALMDDDEDPPPKLPLDELKEKYQKRHGGGGPKFPDDRFVSEDGKTAVMLVQASSHETGYEADADLIGRVRADARELGFPEKYAPGMRLGFAGDVATRVEEMEGLQADLSLSGGLVLLLVLGSIVWFFRSWRSLPIIGIPLIFGTLYTFGLVALPPLSILHLNSNTAFLGSIVVGNGINSGIILLARFREERGRGASVDDGVRIAVANTWRPTLAAALAASAAYGSLIATDFRGFAQFGWIGGIGMITCWATHFVLAPALISWLGAGIRGPKDETAERKPSRLAAAVLTRPGVVLGITTVLIGASVLGLARRRSDWLETDFTQLRRRDSWESGERYWGKRMDATLQRYLTPTVVMTDSPATAARVRERVDQLREAGEAGGLISSTRSASTLLPPGRGESLKEARKLADVLTPKLLEDLEEDERATVKRATEGAALEPLEAKHIPDVLAAGLRENDGRIDRNVLVFPRLTEDTWNADKMHAFATDLRRVAAEESAKGGKATVAGSLLLSSDIISAMKSDGPRATAIALGIVLLVALLAFRRIGLSLAAACSVVVGVLLMLGAMAWAGMKLNFSNFVALPITFGIGADYAINVLERYRAEGGRDLHAAVSSTGGAVALCSLTTIIGFGSLLVAQNQALFSFGAFATSGELACLGTAILSLPAALALISRRATGRAAEPEAPEQSEG